MPEAKEGDTVRVHYKGTLNDGEVFEDTTDKEPLEFTLGEEDILPGFSEAITGMSPGDEKTIEIDSDEAFGPRQEDLVQEVPQDQFPEDIELEEGVQLEIPQEGGGVVHAIVSELGESEVTLDANHPLAGEDLTFEIELVEIV